MGDRREIQNRNRNRRGGGVGVHKPLNLDWGLALADINRKCDETWKNHGVLSFLKSRKS